MKRFEEPEIKVVKFATEDVYTTSGYNGNITDGYVDAGQLFYNNVQGGNDGDIPL